MLFKSVCIIMVSLFIWMATQSTVEGLQCYVCEDCNEYEDFKELHICGEISIVGTTNPVILEEITKKPLEKPTQIPTTKPPVIVGNSEEYIYDDSDEKAQDKKNMIKTRTATESTATIKPNVDIEKPLTRKPTTIASVFPTQNNPIETTLSGTESLTTLSTTLPTTTASRPKPEQLPDYDDYLEYEDPVLEGRNDKSLLKINEPVCYMIRYHANNTIITNRGCTTYINSNKYLTCQSLYNGAPMSTCRICSTNGCNKFLSDDSDEDDHGIFLNAAAPFNNFKVIFVSIGALIIRVLFSVVL